MKTNNTKKADRVQGTPSAKVEEVKGFAEKVAPGDDPGEVTVDQVKKWVQRDLKSAVTLLNGVQADDDCLTHLATFLHGRLSNSKNREAARNQLKMEL